MTTAAYQKKEDQVTSHDAVKRLLGLLDAEPELARRKYASIRNKLANLFRWRGCPAPEEYAARTIEGAARELLDGGRSQLQNPYLYFHRVAISVSNALKGNWAETQSPTTGKAGSGSKVDFSGTRKAESREQLRLECLRECLTALSPESRELITKYHQPDTIDVKEARKELARSLSMTPGALRTRAFNIRSSLVKSVNNCLERSESRSSKDHFEHNGRGSKN
jgi:hypothetical protein